MLGGALCPLPKYHNFTGKMGFKPGIIPALHESYHPQHHALEDGSVMPLPPTFRLEITPIAYFRSVCSAQPRQTGTGEAVACVQSTLSINVAPARHLIRHSSIRTRPRFIVSSIPSYIYLCLPRLGHLLSILRHCNHRYASPQTTLPFIKHPQLNLHDHLVSSLAFPPSNT